MLTWKKWSFSYIWIRQSRTDNSHTQLHPETEVLLFTFPLQHTPSHIWGWCWPAIETVKIEIVCVNIYTYILDILDIYWIYPKISNNSIHTYLNQPVKAGGWCQREYFDFDGQGGTWCRCIQSITGHKLDMTLHVPLK